MPCHLSRHPFITSFFGLLLILVSPLLLFKKKARAGLSQKLGIIPDDIKAKSNSLKGCVWFHAVSVGEFNAVLPLLKKFKALHPQYQLVVSTTTGTGQALAQEKASDLATVIYFPYDLPFATLSWLKTLSPKLVAIPMSAKSVSSDLWWSMGVSLLNHLRDTRDLKCSLVLY